MNVVYVTGNANKSKYFNKMVGLDLPHHGVDVEEIQSLDAEEIVKEKAKAAFNQLKVPVIVEDTSLSFDEWGRLPGPFIKWYVEEIGIEGLAKLAETLNNKGAVAGAKIAYYDGKEMHIFSSQLKGTLSTEKRGDNGFGWSQMFIPEGKNVTMGELNDEEFRETYGKVKPYAQLRAFLDNLA